MQSRRTVLWALTALLALPLGTGCKQDTPSGVIKPAKVVVKVDEVVHLSLDVPTKYDGVNRELWKVEPGELGELYFNQAEVKRREATFRGKKAGAGKIVVRGLYGDAKHPYPIAEVPVTVE